MSRYTPPSIKAVGLREFLNSSAEKHDGYNYDHFVKEIEKGQNLTALARMFKVSRPTIMKWLAVHKEELQA